jgi:hypothetical protein
MNNSLLFTETQKIKQWWLWFILFGVNRIALFGGFKQVICGQPFGKGMAFNVSGDKGLQLEFTNHKKY